MYIFDSEDIRKMDTMAAIVKRGRYLSGADVTELHNKIFNRNLKTTNCATCIKNRWQDLAKAYKIFLDEISHQKVEVEQAPIEVEKTPQIEENKPKRGRKKTV